LRRGGRIEFVTACLAGLEVKGQRGGAVSWTLTGKRSG